MDYKEYLRSKEWLQIRLDILQIKKFKCERCNRKYKPHYYLHVHHLTYKNLGNEEPEDLELLCAGRQHGTQTEKLMQG